MKAFAPNPSVMYRHVQRGFDALNDWRMLAAELMREYKNLDGRRRPVNLIAEMMQAVNAYITVPTVKSRVRAKSSVDTLSAEMFGLVVDDDLEEMRLGEVLEQVGEELMFAPIAVVAVGRHAGERSAEIDGEQYSLQEPFAKLVNLDDLSLDPDATSWETKEFVARRVVIRKGAVGDTLPFGVEPQLGPDGMPVDLPPVPTFTPEEAAEYIARLGTVDDKETEMPKEMENDAGEREDKSDLVALWHCAVYYGSEVWEVWIPDRPQQPPKFLSCRKYNAPQRVRGADGQEVVLPAGSPRGPFESQTFTGFRGSMVGLPGLLLILDLHDAAARLSDKLVKQLRKMKTLIMYKRAQADEAKKVKESADHDLIATDDTKGVTTQKYGEADPQLPAAIEMLGNWFGNAGGGTRQLSGTEAAAPLATVASYMQGGAQMRMNRLRLRISRLGSRITEQVALWRLFGDPAAYFTVDFPLGGDMAVPIAFDPSEFASDAMRFRFGVQAFTAPAFDPALQAQRVLQFFQFVGQSMPYIQAGFMQPAALAETGRTLFGIDNVDALIGGISKSGQLASAAGAVALGGVRMPAGPQQIGAGPANRTDAVRSAMAPRIPNSMSGA